MKARGGILKAQKRGFRKKQTSKTREVNKQTAKQYFGGFLWFNKPKKARHRLESMRVPQKQQAI